MSGGCGYVKAPRGGVVLREEGGTFVYGLLVYFGARRHWISVGDLEEFEEFGNFKVWRGVQEGLGGLVGYADAGGFWSCC